MHNLRVRAQSAGDASRQPSQQRVSSAPSLVRLPSASSLALVALGLGDALSGTQERATEDPRSPFRRAAARVRRMRRAAKRSALGLSGGGAQSIDFADDEEEDGLPLASDYSSTVSGGLDEHSFRAFGGGETMGLAQRCAGPLAALVPDRVCYITLLAGMSGVDLIMLSMSSSWWQQRVRDREMMIPLWRYALVFYLPLHFK